MLSYFGIFFESHLVFYAGVTYVMNLISWLIVCFKFQHHFLFGILNPISTCLMILVAIHSFFSYCFRITIWKDRNISGFKLRLWLDLTFFDLLSDDLEYEEFSEKYYYEPDEQTKFVQSCSGWFLECSWPWKTSK